MSQLIEHLGILFDHVTERWTNYSTAVRILTAVNRGKLLKHSITKGKQNSYLKLFRIFSFRSLLSPNIRTFIDGTNSERVYTSIYNTWISKLIQLFWVMFIFRNYSLIDATLDAFSISTSIIFWVFNKHLTPIGCLPLRFDLIGQSVILR